MSNRTSSTLSFCGRVSELETLKARWKLACNLEDPSPQVVVIKAEPGLGKTRLALEFYKWLRENEDGWLTKSYWPDAVEIVDRNLYVNPEPGKCKLFDIPIPYLWWGLRAADVGAENGVAADAIATYDRFLAPHLAALFLKSEMVHYGWSLAKVMAEVVGDFAASALDIDKYLSVGKDIFHTFEILRGAANKQTLNEAMDRSFSRSDSVLHDLGREFKPGTLTCAKVPGVIFIDDAQFIHDDPALPSFIERLMYTSLDERWPLLIIVTHWRAQMSPEFPEPAIFSFAGIVRHAREGSSTALSPVSGCPGGYLRGGHFTEIDLKPITDLSGALREKLRGLTQEQSTALLTEIDGNPRFLEQVILFLLEHVGYFEDLSPDLSLKPEHFEEILKAMQHGGVVDIALRRLQKAPVEVQEAICLASVQGMRFANAFVDQMAQDLLGRPVREPLGKGEEPYSMLIGTKSDSAQAVGQFAQHLFYLVAKQHRQGLKSLVGEKALQTALENRVRKIVRESDPETIADPEACGLVCGIALNLFEHAVKSEERAVAQRAASIMAYFDLQRGSLESAAALYERLLAIKATEPEAGYDRLEYFVTQYRQRIEILESLAVIYRNLDWPARSAKALRRIKWEAIHYLELPDEFVAALDKEKAAEVFEQWRRDQPGIPAFLYTWSVQKVVSANLNLSELALAGYHQNAADGDEQFTPSSFGIVAYEVTDGVTETDRPVEIPTQTAEILVALAYAQDGVLGDGEAEKQHCRLLEQLGRRAIDRSKFEAAEEYLDRALKIAEDLTDDMFRHQVP